MRSHDPPISEVGQTLCRVVQEQPGIHFRGLARAAHLTSAGQLRHHLDRLKRHGRMVEVQDGRYKRFFLAGHHDPNIRPGLARFSRPVPRQIGKLLLSRPMNRTELRRSLGCADSTLGYHLKRMVELGDLEKNRGRNCCRYMLRDQEMVRKVLMLQENPATGLATAMPQTFAAPLAALAAPVSALDSGDHFRDIRGPRRLSPVAAAALGRAPAQSPLPPPSATAAASAAGTPMNAEAADTSASASAPEAPVLEAVATVPGAASRAAPAPTPVAASPATPSSAPATSAESAPAQAPAGLASATAQPAAATSTTDTET